MRPDLILHHQKLAADMLLGLSSLDRIFCGTSSSEQQVLPWHYHLVSTSVPSKITKSFKSDYHRYQHAHWRHSRDRHGSRKNVNSHPHSTLIVFTTSHWVFCNRYCIRFRYSHCQAQDILKNLWNDICCSGVIDLVASQPYHILFPHFTQEQCASPKMWS